MKTLITLTLLLVSSILYAQTPTTLIYSDHQPLEGMRTKFLKEILFPAIEKESNGRLKIEAYWNGEKAIAYEAINAVTTRKVDISTVVPEYTAKELGLHQIFKSFPVGPSGNKQVEFFREVYAKVPQLHTELDKNNIVPIFFGTGYPVGFFSTTPLNNLDQIQNQKWRSASFWHLDFLTNIGALPIRMHWGNEIYEALQNKELDGIMVNIDSGYNLKLYEHAPNLLVSKNLWLGHLYLVAINKDTWNSLTTEDQNAIQRAANYAYKKLGNTMKQSFKQQIKDLESKGTVVQYLSKKQLKMFKANTHYQQIQNKWATENKETLPNAGTVINSISTILEKYIK